MIVNDSGGDTGPQPPFAGPPDPVDENLRPSDLNVGRAAGSEDVAKPALNMTPGLPPAPSVVISSHRAVSGPEAQSSSPDSKVSVYLFAAEPAPIMHLIEGQLANPSPPFLCPHCPACPPLSL